MKTPKKQGRQRPMTLPLVSALKLSHAQDDRVLKADLQKPPYC